MKKLLSLLAVAGLAFGVTACNSESDPYERVYGSLESDLSSYVIDVYGTKLTAESGYSFPKLSGYQRQLILVDFTYAKGMERVRGEGKTMAVRPEPQGYVLSTTKEPRELGASGYNDPVIALNYEEYDMVNYGLNNTCNLLFFTPIAEAFEKNKTGDDKIARWDYDVEISPEIVPGEKIDTINMYLKFFVNKEEDEKPATLQNSYYNSGSWHYAIDLDYAPSYIPALDKDKTYIIKLNYDGYKVNDYNSLQYDSKTVVQKSVINEWTPNKPYVKVN
ncbi:hypothetical protein LJB87_01495 [Alistipes sp. OttesenSCG-928-L06]|nr:hypothetical protein [Alistipes sp. OttesenSCG-928-L06]